MQSPPKCNSMCDIYHTTVPLSLGFAVAITSGFFCAFGGLPAILPVGGRDSGAPANLAAVSSDRFSEGFESRTAPWTRDGRLPAATWRPALSIDWFNDPFNAPVAWRPVAGLPTEEELESTAVDGMLWSPQSITKAKISKSQGRLIQCWVTWQLCSDRCWRWWVSWLPIWRRTWFLISWSKLICQWWPTRDGIRHGSSPLRSRSWVLLIESQSKVTMTRSVH